MSQSVISILAESLAKKQPAVLATVIRTKGASPAKVGAQLIYLGNGNVFGTTGGGKLEAAILSDASVVLNHGQACTKHYRLTEEGEHAIGTLCGGEVEVFFQPYLPAPRLVIIGGGHIGRPLKIMGEAAGFEVLVVDVEPGRANVPDLEAIDLTFDTCLVLITTDHISDEATLRFGLKSPARYIGMIGSLSKCQTIFEHLIADGYSETDFERVFAPIGLGLGGNRPDEIAVAILAEIIAVRCGHEKGDPIRFRRIQPEKSKAR